MLIRRSSLPATLIAVLAMLAGLLMTAPPAEASSTILCKGFAACKNAGYRHFGYASKYTQMWWRMYAGHNCTNYVAYRMVRNGMSPTRPWSGSGDARNWGNVFASRTNQTPMVGSVAWWSTNHVAYVQQVVDANTIVISEDHWGGDFDWRRIVRSGGGWPTGFIHLTDETLRATAAPGITGTPKVDTPLKATAGAWSIAPSSYAYQWYANGVAIAGATAATYTPTAAQLARTLTVRVAARRYGYRSGAAVSVASAAVAPGTMRTVAVPTVTGLAKVGGVLTVSGGSWQPAATSAPVQWYADGVAIPGATRTTLALGPAQLGKRITATLTGRRAGYLDAPATSLPTAPVAPERLSVTRPPTLTGTPRVGHPLTVTPGIVSPDGVTVGYRWMRDGAWIKGARQQSYTPTVADLGSKLSVQVRYSKEGYTRVKQVLTLPTPVRSVPAIKVRSLAHRSITVTVSAEGVRDVGGTVTIVNAKGVKRTRPLEGGTTTFRPSWLRKGERTITVIFSGSRRVDPRTTVRTVVVK